MIRNVLSSVTAVDVTPDYSDAVRAQLKDAVRHCLRESYSKNRWGQYAAHSALISYQSPDTGEERWGIYYEDDAVLELEEASTRQEAEERYEEFVRSMADCAMPGSSWWQVTDVDGVPVGNGDEDDDR